MIRSFLLIVSVLLAASRLCAQPLDSLLFAIPGQNPGLKGKYRKYEALMERQTQAGQWPEPELGLAFIAFPLPKRFSTPLGYSGDYAGPSLERRTEQQGQRCPCRSAHRL